MIDDSSPNPQPQLLGDVVISVETAGRHARKSRCTLHEEIIVLLIHGILHLLGYDHEKSAGKEKKMRAREKEIFKKLMEDKKISAAVTDGK